jgi:acetyl esterase/lipase
LGANADQIKPNALILGYPVIDLTLVSPVLADIPGEAEPLLIGEAMLTKTLGSPRPAQADLDRYRADLYVSPATPPTFLWHTADDELVPARNSLLFATALADHRVPYELHIFDHGVHGLALADEVTQAQDRFVNPHCQIWPELAIKWLKRLRFI